MCLFAIRKVDQWKILFSQRKIWLGFQENIFPLAVFVFRNVVSGKSFSKLYCVCLPLGKLVNGKHFTVKGKFDLVFRNVFSWKIWGENTFWKLKKFRNVIICWLYQIWSSNFWLLYIFCFEYLFFNFIS